MVNDCAGDKRCDNNHALRGQQQTHADQSAQAGYDMISALFFGFFGLIWWIVKAVAIVAGFIAIFTIRAAGQNDHDDMEEELRRADEDRSYYRR